MIKADVIEQIQAAILADKSNSKREFTQKKITSILDSFFDVVKESVAEGNKIELRGFGTFDLREIKEKEIKNPRNNQSILVHEHAVPVFKPGKDFKRKTRDSLKRKK